MRQDPQVREEARNTLGDLFSSIGRRAQGETDDSTLSGLLGDSNMAEQLAEFLSMPLDMARLFTEMGFDLAELVLKSLGEAGYVLVKGLTPA